MSEPSTCPDCGAELDDFGPCACSHDHARKPGRPKTMAMTMREMVARKLAAKAAAKK